MSSKRSLSGGASASAEKRARKSETLKWKLDVIKRNEEGQTVAMISRAVAEKIKGSIKAGTTLISHKSSYNRARIMEKILTAWLQEQHCRNVPLSQAIVCAKGRSIFNDLKGDSDVKSFTASDGWLSNFKAVMVLRM
jgi:hypothetical protein